MSMNYGYSPNTIQYTIQSGDSLWDLADEYNTTAEAIAAANPGIDPNNLNVGQVLSIPSDLFPVSAEQFRRFGPGFRHPFFRRRFPFRRFRRPFFREPFFEEFEEFPFFGFGGPFWWNGFWWF
jgi:murein DD-endopeptidase MepM/ murein hydrolase activator NlpD